MSKKSSKSLGSKKYKPQEVRKITNIKNKVINGAHSNPSNYKKG